ncbi:LSAMP [Cordylochernes scorpioides]|uniref:LSAMP n=1 Tax=Cordylochernes scorpioides TaxID=51811 RepID=A0ABY6LG84_9ARAC|nr:LSAMP [Cordylochernes scorpioides]
MPDHRKRRQFKQTDAFTRGMVIGLKRAGWSIRQISADTHLGASTVHRLWRRWLEQGNVAIYRNVGATRVTSARVDRRILRQAVAAPQATCTAILQHVQYTLDHSISTRTIYRRLVANGLHSCRPLRRLPLTPPNRRQRLEWCRARSTWMKEWHRVVFSDESRFCLSSDSRRVRVWRRRGERSNPAAIVERPTVRQRGIMVWGAIAYDSRSPLLRIQGTMTAQRYVDDVLRPVTLPYLQGVPNALYQQDNARPHTARISQQALQDVQMLPWPPYSPDLSPIEHVWDIIGRRLHALRQPRSEDELWQMVEREWRAIPQDAIRTLIDSLPRRVAACIAVRVPPDIIDSESSTDVLVREGSNVTLSCRAKGVPSPVITWKREDGQPIAFGNWQNNKGHDMVYSGDDLAIVKISRLHMGAYLCIASNEVQPSVSRRILLQVHCKYSTYLIKHTITVCYR